MTAPTTSAGRPRRRAVLGTVYLLHFNAPYRHARHYTGWSANPPARIAAHTAGNGARLVRAVQAAGIGFVVARKELGTRARERQLKKQGGASRRCPICRATRRTSQRTNPGTSNPGGAP